MSTITTYAKPVNDLLTFRIPEEYRSCSFHVILIPKADSDDAGEGRGNHPAWAGLCESAITKNADGPHDMASIRESIKSAKRVSAI